MECLNEGFDCVIAVAGDYAIRGTDLWKLGRLHHQVPVGNEGERLAMAEGLIDEMNGQTRFAQRRGALPAQDNGAVINHRWGVRRSAKDLLRLARGGWPSLKNRRCTRRRGAATRSERR